MLPPVFVMNAYYSGLGIARSLHGLGMRVYALTSERDAPGTSSRYFHGVYEVPNGRDEPERLRDRLIDLRGGFPERPVLFPTRDFDVLFLHEYREALASAYVLPQPADSPILRMMDKLELATIAKQQAIPTPATVVCRSAAELEREIAALRFPLIVKPRFAYQWRRKDVWERVGAAKAIIVSSPAELRARYRQLSGATQEVLLQEYVSGDDNDIVVCGCYIGRNGDLLGHFTGRKLKQNPPLVGTGSVVEAAEVGPILDVSVELLKAFRYSGLAEIEFKYDRAADRFSLIEINPRHWDQHELGTLVGVNLSWIAYRDMVGSQNAPCRPVYRANSKYKWIAEQELLEDIAHNFSLRTLRKATREWVSLLSGRKVLGLMSWRDPVPGVLLWWRLLSHGLRRLVRARARPALAGLQQRKAGE